jgi:tetratricopeptide (TPR) repeat protein
LPVISCGHACRLAGVLSLALLLAACSHTLQSTRLQQAPPTQIPLAAELSATPFFAQSRYQCGPAALATVLAHRGVSVVPDSLVDKVYLPEREGSVPLEMEAAARGYGMLVYPLGQALESLLGEIAAGNPVLVLQNLGFDWWPRWHYAVAIGYDLSEGEIILRSGVRRRYVVSLRVFETTWRRAGYWARVVMPPDTLPASAEALGYIRAALALEQSAQEAAALSGYRAATGQWPDSAPAWLARGNLAYRLGMDEEAEASFRQGVQAVPGDAALWNNLGYALARRQCAEEALAAVRCAIVLEPESEAYRNSLDELSGQAQGTAACEAVVCPSLRPVQGD